MSKKNKNQDSEKFSPSIVPEGSSSDRLIPTSRGMMLVVAVAFGLNETGVIDIPFVNQVTDLPFGTGIKIIILMLPISVLIWTYTKKVLNRIYEPPYREVILFDHFGEKVGIFETHRDTFSELENHVDIVDGVVKTKPRLSTKDDVFFITDVDEPDDDGPMEVTGVQGWDSLETADQTFASESAARTFIRALIDKARMGDKLEKSEPARMEVEKGKAVSDVVTDMEEATGTLGAEEAKDDAIDEYERSNEEPDDFVREDSIVPQDDDGVDDSEGDSE